MVISSSLSVKELEKLKGYVLGERISRVPTTNQYELLRVKDNDVSFIVYKSGKIVYEDNPNTIKFISRVFESRTENDFELGSDEAGKGEWYGPLVIVCAALRPEHLKSLRIRGVKDSKELSTSEIHRLAKEMERNGIIFRSVILDPITYNSKVKEFNLEYKNVNEILAWAHSAILRDLVNSLQFKHARITIDQFDFEKMNRRLFGIDKERVSIIQMMKGESQLSVAAASIMAKHIFEREVDKLCSSFGIDFRRIEPNILPPDILKETAKVHFKNISELIEKKGHTK